VCALDEPDDQRQVEACTSVLDLLGRLVDKSLEMTVQAGSEERYRLLEMPRQYARERLRVPGAEPMHGLRMAWIMWRLWWVRGYLSEGRQRLAELLALARASGPRQVLARGLVSAGLLAMWQADYAAAAAHLEEALTLAGRFGDRRAASAHS
jgi:predicted ATPase